MVFSCTLLYTHTLFTPNGPQWTPKSTVNNKTILEKKKFHSSQNQKFSELHFTPQENKFDMDNTCASMTNSMLGL